MSSARRLAVVVASALSAALGAVLIAIGVVSRRDRTVAVGKRRFHGFAFERRWISDHADRERHAAVVADRLELDVREPGEVTLAEAAERLGVTIGTVRRRAKRGRLQGAYRNGRLAGIVLDAE
jgi:hypothetical protein